ncbi:hypothetical protein [Methylobacterium nodulans]|uniref:Uncharacterized protein n=1 Tax=Methylobacterium nodulans (strain LMG 21967 / CNCM I-2342 / ORS 2060) TaxID=460265 RepID=B8INT9_METNO|nr:hypothetical protein [Methylobacterium nodulans]ACL58455.1 hypothetical protein Mnod_3545 [Methylobacterium nodulans ORS 2060]
MRVLIVPDPGRDGHRAAEAAAEAIRAVVPCEVALLIISPSASRPGPAVCREILLAQDKTAPSHCAVCGLGPCRERA